MLPNLEMEDYLEIELGYTNALFELGRYESFLASTQFLLESLIYHNVQFINGEDVYEKLLVRKAAAHFNLLELEIAETVLWEILKMNPQNRAAEYLLQRTLIRLQPNYLKNCRSLGICLFLLSAIIIGAELLFFRPFYERHVDTLKILEVVVFLGAVFIIVAADSLHRLRSHRRVRNELFRLRALKL